MMVTKRNAIITHSVLEILAKLIVHFETFFKVLEFLISHSFLFFFIDGFWRGEEVEKRVGGFRSANDSCSVSC